MFSVEELQTVEQEIKQERLTRRSERSFVEDEERKVEVWTCPGETVPLDPGQ